MKSSARSQSKFCPSFWKVVGRVGHPQEIWRMNLPYIGSSYRLQSRTWTGSIADHKGLRLMVEPLHCTPKRGKAVWEPHCRLPTSKFLPAWLTKQIYMSCTSVVSVLDLLKPHRDIPAEPTTKKRPGLSSNSTRGHYRALSTSFEKTCKSSLLRDIATDCVERVPLSCSEAHSTKYQD